MWRLPCPAQGSGLQDVVLQPPPGAAGTYPGAPPGWWSCCILATAVGDDDAVVGADGAQEPRAASLDCGGPQQVPSRLAPLTLPRGLRDATLRTSLLPLGPAVGMAAPAPHPAFPAGPGDLQSFAHPLSSGKDKRSYLESPSWHGAGLGSGVPASPRFLDPWALEVSQPEKGAGPGGAGTGREGLWSPLRPWLAVPGLRVGAGALLCPVTWALS